MADTKAIAEAAMDPTSRVMSALRRLLSGDGAAVKELHGSLGDLIGKYGDKAAAQITQGLDAMMFPQMDAMMKAQGHTPPAEPPPEALQSMAPPSRAQTKNAIFGRGPLPATTPAPLPPGSGMVP